MPCVGRVETPQLLKLHRGKVRDSFRVDEKTRLIVATDRLSAFDRVLDSLIPRKGEVLNQLAAWWFAETRDIVANHLVRTVGPSAALVREAEPIRIETVVRGYLTGSMWRGYKRGKRVFSGIEVPDGLEENGRFAEPLLTPTTKEKSDREIDPEAIAREGWTTPERYAEMAEVARKLFARGTERLAAQGLLLVDTKYEFGLIDDELVLIDEIHTPDSSRFWAAKVWEKDPAAAESLDKEYVRRWLLDHEEGGEIPPVLPDDVVEETSRRYLDIYERVTGAPVPDDGGRDPRDRLYEALLAEGLIRDGFVAIVMGSPSDAEYCRKIRDAIERNGVACEMRVASAHKNGEAVVALAAEYNHAIEPGAIIAVAGRSNGLGGALAANLCLPVINAPPFRDQVDLLANVNSSLMMPSRTPAMTVVSADAAARAALRCLNVRRLKDAAVAGIARTKAELAEADKQMRGSTR